MKQPMSMGKAMRRMLGAVIAVVLALAYFKYRQFAAFAAMAFTPPPEAVTSAVAELTPWSPAIELVGSLDAPQGVVLKAEEKGSVEKINFESGALVNAGDVLVQLDIAVEEGQLKAAEAKADWARISFKRAKLLKAGNATAEAAVDEANANLKTAEGEVAALRAQIARKTITAPFSGRTGIRRVNLGEYVPEGSEIVPLFSDERMHLNFSVPQSYMKALVPGQKVEITVDAYSGKTFTGELTAIDPQVNPDTRNVHVQATFANPEGLLRPGMFAHLQLFLAGEEKLITIPGSAINHAPYGDSVYVIENMKGPDGKEYLGVTQKFVKVGDRRGDQVAIIKGLEAGQQVATSGLFKLRPGGAVVVNNTVTPKNEQNPRPPDT